MKKKSEGNEKKLKTFFLCVDEIEENEEKSLLRCEKNCTHDDENSGVKFHVLFSLRTLNIFSWDVEISVNVEAFALHV